MRLENEHTHYRARFDMFAYERQDDVAPHILQVLYNWMCGKESKRSKGGQRSWLLDRLEDTAFNYHAEYPDHVSTGCYTSKALLRGMSFPGGYDGGMATGEDSKLCSMSFVGNGDEDFPQYWAMDYDEPDGGLWARRWHTSVGIASEGRHCVVNVRITNYLDPRYVGNPPRQPNSTTPNFVRELVSLKGFRTHVGNMVLSEQAIKLTLLNFKDGFVSSLTSDKRELPLILVATDNDGSLPVNVRDLAYKVLGMARVFVLDYTDPDLRRQVRETFVHDQPSWEYRTGPGFVRVYRPHVSLSSTIDATRHRFFGREDIERYGKAFNDMLARSLTRSWAQDENDVVDILDVSALARRARNAELRERLERLSESSRAAVAAGHARRDHESDASIEELRRLLEERDRAIDDLEENNALWQTMAEDYASDLESATELAERERAKTQAQVAGYVAELAEKESDLSELRDQVSRLEYELKSARSQVGDLSERLGSASHALQSFEGISHVPDRLSDLLELLPTIYPGRVCVLEEAKKSARAFDGRYDLDDELAILRSIPTVLWELYFGATSSDNISKDYQVATGFELALTEGSMTNKGSKYVKQRLRMYHGQGIYIFPHIKGRANDTKNAFRVHYYADAKRNVIVIGHCGEHLETAGTSKSKH